MNASDVLVESLIEWGVEMVFGLPGDGINGIMEALRTRQDKIRFIHVRHEETAAFMACGYAKYTGKLGVCLATSGPGGIHLLNGLYDAKLDGAPVLAITGLQFHDLIGTHTQQDVALDKLYMDVCVYNERIMGATHIENVIDLACRTAISYGGVAHITIPVDFQEKELKKRERSKRNIPDHTSTVRTRSYKIPDESQLQQAADILNAGKKTGASAGVGHAPRFASLPNTVRGSVSSRAARMGWRERVARSNRWVGERWSCPRMSPTPSRWRMRRSVWKRSSALSTSGSTMP